MAAIAEFTLPTDEFPLGTVFSTLPEATVQLERVVPDANGVAPYFWVRGTEADAVVEQFATHPGVREVREVDRTNGEHLMRCSWIQEYESILDALVTPGVVLLSAVGTATEWTFEVRGETREDIAEFWEYCHDNDVPATLTELHALRPLEVRQGLTDAQREALVLAYERGYFESPRETTLEEIAEDLDISQQALGSRLRRGNRRLVERTLIEPHS